MVINKKDHRQHQGGIRGKTILVLALAGIIFPLLFVDNLRVSFKITRTQEKVGGTAPAITVGTTITTPAKSGVATLNVIAQANNEHNNPNDNVDDEVKNFLMEHPNTPGAKFLELWHFK